MKALKTLSILLLMFLVFGAANHQGVRVAQVLEFSPAQAELPESMEMGLDGRAYFSMSFQRRIVVASSFEAPRTYADLNELLPEGSIPAGITFDHSWQQPEVPAPGTLYAVVSGFGPTQKGVMSVTPDGELSWLATLPSQGFPNDIAYDWRGDVFYVTDAWLGRVYRITSGGDVAVWLEDERLLPNLQFPQDQQFGANGIALNQERGTLCLYVGNLNHGTVSRSCVQQDGAGPLETVVDNPVLLGGLDGLEFGNSGILYGAVNFQNRVVDIDTRTGKVGVSAEGGALDGPSSLAFGKIGNRHGFEMRTLYVANFAVGNFLAGQPGNPGMLAVEGVGDTSRPFSY